MSFYNYTINLLKILAERLRYAIVHCTEMDADFKLTETEVAGWNLPQQQSAWNGSGVDD